MAEIQENTVEDDSLEQRESVDRLVDRAVQNLDSAKRQPKDTNSDPADGTTPSPNEGRRRSSIFGALFSQKRASPK